MKTLKALSTKHSKILQANAKSHIQSKDQLTLLPPSPSAPRLPQYSLLILVSNNNASFKDRNDQDKTVINFPLFFGHGKLCGSGNTTHATVLDAGLTKILWQHKTLVTCDGQLTRCEVHGVSYLGKIR